MNYISVIIMTCITFTAGLIDRKKEVPPLLWVIAMIACCISNYIHGGKEMLLEGCIACSITVVCSFVFVMILPNMFGGAVYKSFCAAAVALGRYVLIELGIFVIFFPLMVFYYQLTRRKQEEYERGSVKVELLLPLSGFILLSYVAKVVLHL